MKYWSPTAALSALALSTVAAAAPAQYCPQDQVCYSVAVPEQAASADKGNIYLQLRAPDTYSWVAMGQGTSMRGANIFVMYADGSGNVTVSARAGEGHALPEVDPNVKIQLLAGSGVVNGSMVANVRCSNCESWAGGQVSLKSTSSDWIAAWSAGAPINSKDQNAAFNRHDAHAAWKLDLTQATVSADGNPYLSGSGGMQQAVQTEDDGAAKYARIIMAHWLVMLFVWLVMYPIGSGLMPLLGKWWLHAAWQMFAFVLMWAGFALGWTAVHHFGEDFNVVHTQFGLAIVILISLQPVFGWLHHRHFLAQRQRGAISHVHIWYGRILMLLGIINGGIGIQWANKNAGTTGGPVAIGWGVVAGVMGVVYLAAACFGIIRRKKAEQSSMNGEPKGSTASA